MLDAAYFREQATRTQRLINAVSDQLTRERLEALVEEYLAKAHALDGEAAGYPSETL
jgi:hypothetical protein